MDSSFFGSRWTAPRTRLQVEALEDRTVPAMIDLTTAGAVGTAGGAIFFQANPQPTGVGVIHDFLRVQSHHHNVIEQGYNSDVRPVQFDEKTDPHTRSIRVSELPLVSIGGTDYRVILLGVNQAQSSPLISLDELRIYVADTATIAGYNPGAQTLAGLPAAFDMGDNWVALNSALSHGNGSGDMFLFVPATMLRSPSGANDAYFYLYSKFGAHYSVNGGFEQWAPGHDVTLPPVTTASVGGFVYWDVNLSTTLDDGDVGLEGVILTLTGTTDQQQPVTMTTQTGPGGVYIFTGLLPGTYTITETQPPGFLQGVNSVGTVNGNPDGDDLGNDQLGNIVLATGNQGINYNFGEAQDSGN